MDSHSKHKRTFDDSSTNSKHSSEKSCQCTNNGRNKDNPRQNNEISNPERSRATFNTQRTGESSSTLHNVDEKDNHKHGNKNPNIIHWCYSFLVKDFLKSSNLLCGSFVNKFFISIGIILVFTWRSFILSNFHVVHQSLCSLFFFLIVFQTNHFGQDTFFL